jgi:hypothetical protein
LAALLPLPAAALKAAGKRVGRNKRSALRHLMDGFSQTDWLRIGPEAAQ